MNGRNRHNKYRRSIYRRHNIGIIILISVIAFIVLLVSFLIVGNILHRQSEKRNEQNTETEETTLIENTDAVKVDVPSIKGHSVLLETTDTTFISDRLDALTNKQIYAASIPLNTKDGTLLYKSSIAASIGYPAGTANVTLSKAVSTAEQKNIYLSGVFYVNAFSENDPLLRSVELSKDAAIIAEALSEGFGDVVIIAPHMTEEHIDEVIRFVDDIRTLSDGGAIGLTVSDSILELEAPQRTSEIISVLNEKIDFLAINLPNREISEMINTNKLYIHMYKMRVLLPFSENTDEQNTFVSAVDENGITNWQIIQ